jgi:periplasmic protein CpxP/Spy
VTRGWFALFLVLVAGAPAAAQRPAEPDADRARLETRFRQAFARVVRDRVGLNDGQMRRLGPVNEKYADQRRQLQLEERAARLALQRALRVPETADSAQVSALLDRMLRVQQQRVELLRAEQRELAAFMTPVQRARYMALQEQLRRQLEQRGQGRGGGGPPPRRGPPPL